MIYLLLITYTSFAFGIHGGEGITGINRQVRNLLCAIPFGLVCGHVFDLYIGMTCFALAYGGVSLGFYQTGLKLNYPALIAKGMITCPFGGVVIFPLAYWVGYKSKYTNVFAEYFSGTLYGVILAGLLLK